jgi:Arc/MetJ-type ribon-helix-helix transcriptional regulator
MSGHSVKSEHDEAVRAPRRLGIGLPGRTEALAALLDAIAPTPPPSSGASVARPIASNHLQQDPDQSSLRSRAAEAVRRALVPLLANRMPRRTLRDAARRAAGPHLSAAEIATLTNEAIAAFLRSHNRRKPASPA